MRNLEAIFSKLNAPSADQVLASENVPSVAGYRVARDKNDDALLLIDRTGPVEESARRIRLQHFAYEPHQGATVVDATSGATTAGSFLVIRCHDADADLRRHFFDLVDGLITQLGDRPDPPRVDKAVRDLVEIFRSMSGAAKRSISGLWAELLLIAYSTSPELASGAWHADPMEVHDFSLGADKVEVKATTRPVRAHELSLDQLYAPGAVALVSVMLELSDIGTSGRELLHLATSRLPLASEARQRMNKVCTSTLGEDWRELNEARFNQETALSSIRWFEAKSVPSVSPQVPFGVSKVRFTSDLSNIEPLGESQIRAHSPLAAALMSIPNHAR